MTEVGNIGMVVAVLLLSGAASSVGAALAVDGGGTSVAVGMEGSGVGAGVTKQGVGAVTVAETVVSVGGAVAAGSDTTGGLDRSTAGSAAGSFSGGGVGSEGCSVTFGSSEESEEAARRLLKDTAEATALD